ncbi:protein kinase [Cryobacterium zongtaii]|nr:protein kinase [Cryobacterium zongtaii]
MRLYRDELLECDRVGKRIDLSMVDESSLPEAATLQQISHRNVVDVISAVEVDNYVNDPTMRVIEIITPYYKRGSITDVLLRGEVFSTHDAVLITQAALRGLRELHVGHRIAHRDIKSGNILLADDRVHALIADLGVAGRFDKFGEVVAVNNPTIYSPPELLTTGVLTAASDLYSMGLVLRELLGGRFRYENYNRADIVSDLEAGKVPLHAEDLELPIWTPTSLRKVIAKATHIDPKKRFQEAKQLDEALGRIRIANWNSNGAGVWEATHHATPAQKYRMEAKPLTDGMRISLKKRSANGWRRPVGYPDFDTSSFSTREARARFDTANDLAAS